MASRIHLKLFGSIIVVFALLVTGYILYGPAWYMWQGRKLCSGDMDERIAALEKVAAMGESAIPHIRKWLKSSDDYLVIASCELLDRIKSHRWEQALPELKEILYNEPSMVTVSAAGVVFKKDYACAFSGPQIIWKHFAGNRNAKLSICFAMLQDRDPTMRYAATNTLGRLGDARAVEPLIGVLRNDSDSNVTGCAVRALSHIGNTCIEPLIKVLGNDLTPRGRARAASALGEISNSSAVTPLANALENDSSSLVRRSAAIALGTIGGPQIVEPLINALGNDVDSRVRSSAVVALGKTRDLRVIGPLLRTLESERNRTVKVDASRTLSKITGRMPDGFPVFNFNPYTAGRGSKSRAIKARHTKEIKALKAWLKKHLHRLAWDAKKQKFYLLPENNEQE